jgi:hypothetical protein
MGSTLIPMRNLSPAFGYRAIMRFSISFFAASLRAGRPSASSFTWEASASRYSRCRAMS